MRRSRLVPAATLAVALLAGYGARRLHLRRPDRRPHRPRPAAALDLPVRLRAAPHRPSHRRRRRRRRTPTRPRRAARRCRCTTSSSSGGTTRPAWRPTSPSSRPPAPRGHGCGWPPPPRPRTGSPPSWPRPPATTSSSSSSWRSPPRCSTWARRPTSRPTAPGWRRSSGATGPRCTTGRSSASPTCATPGTSTASTTATSRRTSPRCSATSPCSSRAIETVKATDPTATVLFGGLSEAKVERYLRAVMTTDASRYFDIMDFHAYGQTPDSVLSRYRSFRRSMHSQPGLGRQADLGRVRLQLLLERQGRLLRDRGAEGAQLRQGDQAGHRGRGAGPDLLVHPARQQPGQPRLRADHARQAGPEPAPAQGVLRADGHARPGHRRRVTATSASP